MMPLKLVPPTLILLLIPNGVGAQNGWVVTYRPNSIFALKGSTVIMSCTYSYPPGHTVQKTFWTKSWPSAAGVEPPDLLDDPEYRDRIQYFRDKQHVCRLSLRDVRESNESKYHFRFITKNLDQYQYQGTDGVYLSVTDLQVEVPERVMEEDNVTLTCKTTCRLTDRPSFTWYRNGAPLSSSTEQLYLQSVSRKDTGRYSCAVLDQNLHSPGVTLNVLYPPKNMSVSISPSGEIMEGSLVTLTCNSDGNPPVQKYTWFKDGGNSPVGSGHSYSFILDSESSGRYYCEAQNEHGSKRSDAVPLSFKRNLNVTLYIIGGVVFGCVGLILVLVILFIRRKRRGPVKKQENIYSGVAVGATSNDPPADAANQDDGLYARVEPPRLKKPRTKEHSAVSHEEVQYSTIQCSHGQEVKKTGEDDVQYASVNFSRTTPAHRSDAPEDPSVIYSGVK